MSYSPSSGHEAREFSNYCMTRSRRCFGRVVGSQNAAAPCLLTRVRRRALGVWTLSGSVCLSAGRLPGAACIMEDAGRAMWIMGGRGIPAHSDAWPSHREIMFFALSSMSTSPAQI
ncbi:unnamed protein product [Boreogadus saida]